MSSSNFVQGTPPKDKKKSTTILQGLQITCTAVDRETRLEIEKACALHGATYTPCLYKDKTSHLIVAENAEITNKYICAKKWKIWTVSPDWFFDSIDEGVMKQEYLYEAAINSPKNHPKATTTPQHPVKPVPPTTSKAMAKTPFRNEEDDDIDWILQLNETFSVQKSHHELEEDREKLDLQTAKESLSQRIVDLELENNNLKKELSHVVKEKQELLFEKQEADSKIQHLLDIIRHIQQTSTRDVPVGNKGYNEDDDDEEVMVEESQMNDSHVQLQTPEPMVDEPIHSEARVTMMVEEGGEGEKPITASDIDDMLAIDEQLAIVNRSFEMEQKYAAHTSSSPPPPMDDDDDIFNVSPPLSEYDGPTYQPLDETKPGALQPSVEATPPQLPSTPPPTRKPPTQPTMFTPPPPTQRNQPLSPFVGKLALLCELYEKEQEMMKQYEDSKKVAPVIDKVPEIIIPDYEQHHKDDHFGDIYQTMIFRRYYQLQLLQKHMIDIQQALINNALSSPVRSDHPDILRKVSAIIENIKQDAPVDVDPAMMDVIRFYRAIYKLYVKAWEQYQDDHPAADMVLVAQQMEDLVCCLLWALAHFGKNQIKMDHVEEFYLGLKKKRQQW